MLSLLCKCFKRKQCDSDGKSPAGDGTNSLMCDESADLRELSSSDPFLFRAPDLQSNVVWEHKDQRDPMKYYDVIDVLGHGSMGTVSKVKKKESAVGGSARKGGNNDAAHNYNKQHQDFCYALKSVKLERVSKKQGVQSLRSEIEIIKSLDHPYIVRAIETFDFANQLFLVMELCSGGDLNTRAPYTEREAARIVASVLSAVAYMHNREIMHRDLKYENVLFANESRFSEVKLIDFGISQRYQKKQPITQRVGTVFTMAPEVIRGSYTKQADVWSVGVMAYRLLADKRPFDGKTNKEVVKKIKQGSYSLKGKEWSTISPHAKDFVKSLLIADPDLRPTAEEAARSKWLALRTEISMKRPEQDELTNIQHSLETYVEYSKLKKLALFLIAHKSTNQEIGVLRTLFEVYDVRHNGIISFNEFKRGLAKYGYTNKELQTMFQAMDLDGTGKIRYTEFLAATIESQGQICEERIAEAFDRLDCDDTGFITAKNLSEILGPNFSEKDITQIIRDESHGDCENRIAYNQFLHMWHPEEFRDEPHMNLES